MSEKLNFEVKKSENIERKSAADAAIGLDYRSIGLSRRIRASSLARSRTHRKVAESLDETIENLLEFLGRDDHRLAVRRFRRPLAEEFNLRILGKVRVEPIGESGGEKRFAVENGFDRFRHRARAGSHDLFFLCSLTNSCTSCVSVALRSCARACDCVSKRVDVSVVGENKKTPGCDAGVMDRRSGPPPERVTDGMYGDDADTDEAWKRARVEELRVKLKARDDAYELEHPSERSSLAGSISTDPEWLREYEEVKRLERALATPPGPGCCRMYVARKRRYCIARARDGGTMCTRHRQYEEDEADGESVLGSVLSTLALGTGTPDAASMEGRKKQNINRRMKKMTNPLSQQFQAPKVLDDEYWKGKFTDVVNRPTLVDVGSAKGGFIKALASDCATACTKAKNGTVFNLLGVEIYEPLVEAANIWVETHAKRLARDAHFVSANANVSMSSLNVPNLRAVCVQFPDPWSRGKHAARRVMTPQFTRTLAELLPVGGELYCCSDVLALAEEMYDVVLANEDFEIDETTYCRLGEMVSPSRDGAQERTPHFDAAHKYEWERQTEIDDGDADGKPADGLKRRWLSANPYAAHTERDIVCEGKWRPVYRFAVVRV